MWSGSGTPRIVSSLLGDMIEALSENDLDLDAVLPSHYICKWEIQMRTVKSKPHFPLVFRSAAFTPEKSRDVKMRRRRRRSFI